MKRSQSGATPGPVLAFLAVLLIGIVVAVLLFLPKIKEQLAEAEAAKIEESQPVEAPQPAMPAAAPAFPTDASLAANLVAKLKENDIEGFLTLLGEQGANAEVRERIRTLLVDQKFTLDPTNPLVEVGRDGEVKKWALNLMPPAEMQGIGPRQIELNLTKGANGNWAVSKVVAPDLKAEIASMAVSNGGVPTDPMGIARLFVDSVISLNFQKAKEFVNSGKLSEEKLAALFIVVEQGAYKLRPDKPLIATVAQKDVAWVIANLSSKADSSQFGIEMERANEADAWRIVGLNFDKMMQTVAMDAGAGGVAFEPYKPNPQGGESLVLYFEFDKDGLNPRATKQLEVIAGILKADTKRVLNINGYADAVGDEVYNEGLSNKRAANVRAALQALGVNPQQVVTKAFGESAPKAPNFNPDGTPNTSGQAQNRRAEVYLEF